MKLSFLQLVSMFVLIKLGSAPYAPGKSFFGKKIPILFVQWPWDKVSQTPTFIIFLAIKFNRKILSAKQKGSFNFH